MKSEEAMVSFTYDLVVHYRQSINTIWNVDPDRYCYIDLMQDVAELSLSHVSVIIGFYFTIYCDIPGCNDRMLVESDVDLLKMFEIHKSGKINVYVDTMSSTSAVVDPSSTTVPFGTAHANDTVTISSQTTKDEDSDNDDLYGLTFKDEDFLGPFNENLGGFNTFHDFSYSFNFEIHSGDELLDFESDDDVEYNFSSETSSFDEGTLGKYRSGVLD
ncbi:hypothetical protein F0562_029276 [Nyssa sinensis]|uniref:Uncharacterized protein n=1 Tax=Nyssa sinensis TaxID=561372 RepID=A0A5J5B2D9_9ASTE|nr:hypothetical protein F0562_029276 [Nyssa sinensis]